MDGPCRGWPSLGWQIRTTSLESPVGCKGVLWSQTAAPVTSRVTSAKPLKLSVPQFPHGAVARRKCDIADGVQIRTSGRSVSLVPRGALKHELDHRVAGICIPVCVNHW